MEYPGDGRISVSPSRDEGTFNLFRGTHWREHSLISLEHHAESLLFFTPEAFAFFLSAFMLSSLDQPDSGLADDLSYRLTPPKNDPRRPSYWEWWSELTPGQRMCVVAFVECFQARNPLHFGVVIESLSNAVDA